MLFLELNVMYFTLALSAVCVPCLIWLFFVCGSLISCIPGMLLRYFLNKFEMLLVAPIITGETFVFIFHMRCIYIVTSLYRVGQNQVYSNYLYLYYILYTYFWPTLYFGIFSASFLITFRTPTPQDVQKEGSKILKLPIGS